MLPLILGAAGGTVMGYNNDRDMGEAVLGGAAGGVAGGAISIPLLLSYVKGGAKKQHNELLRKKNLSEQDRRNLAYLNKEGEYIITGFYKRAIEYHLTPEEAKERMSGLIKSYFRTDLKCFPD